MKYILLKNLEVWVNDETSETNRKRFVVFKFDFISLFTKYNCMYFHHFYQKFVNKGA